MNTFNVYNYVVYRTEKVDSTTIIEEHHHHLDKANINRAEHT